jgi:glycosyltransferase involved in cell wall biosynthesis
VRACAIVPAYESERTVSEVVAGLRRHWPRGGDPSPVLVVDDGSRDATAAVAAAAGARVVSHPENRGKGVALRTGMAIAYGAGFDVAVTVDADGQHPASEAVKLLSSAPDPGALVLGIRDLGAAGAPRANRLSNRFSNLVISLFCGRRLGDTQCGLRRYPLGRTLDLGAEGEGYDFEAEVLLLAVAAGLPIVETPIHVLYPPAGERVTHFHSVRDPARIVARVVATTIATRFGRRPMRPISRRAEPGARPTAGRDAADSSSGRESPSWPPPP